MQLRFGDHVLDIARRELRRGGEPIALQPQVFDLLVYLIRNRDRVVTKDDLVNAVWGGRIISESTFTSRINAARKAVGDSGDAQRLIRTTPRKGLRFIAEVVDELPAEPALPNALQNRASIAVLPFENLSEGREQEYFADGIVAEIITGLSRNKMVVRDLAEFDLLLQGQADRREGGRPGIGRALCARRQRAPVG